jgi:hypothetical protein
MWVGPRADLDVALARSKPAPRVVSCFVRCIVSDASGSVSLTVWRPDSELIDLLCEGRAFSIEGVSVAKGTEEVSVSVGVQKCGWVNRYVRV